MSDFLEIEDLQDRLINERDTENLVICTIEEMSELTKVLIKYLRSSSKFSLDDLEEEGAHCFLMIDTILQKFKANPDKIVYHQLDALKRCFNLD